MKLLSTGAVAKMLGYSPPTVRNLCDSGVLPYVRLTGPTARRRILLSDLEAYPTSYEERLHERTCH